MVELREWVFARQSRHPTDSIMGMVQRENCFLRNKAKLVPLGGCRREPEALGSVKYPTVQEGR